VGSRQRHDPRTGGCEALAVTSGGTIPDRGLFGVFLPDGTRVGELDEEMVYESRPARCSCSARRRGGSRTSTSRR
jgi:Lhr-like helicase